MNDDIEKNSNLTTKIKPHTTQLHQHEQKKNYSFLGEEGTKSYQKTKKKTKIFTSTWGTKTYPQLPPPPSSSTP